MKLDHHNRVAGANDARAGFTVMEVLLAMSLTVVIIGGIIGGVVTYSRANAAAESLEVLNVSAKVLEDQLRRDLVLVSRTRTFTEVGSCPATVMSDGTSGEDPGGGTPPDWIEDDEWGRWPEIGIPTDPRDPGFGINPPRGPGPGTGELPIDPDLPPPPVMPEMPGTRIWLLSPTDGTPFRVDYLHPDEGGILRVPGPGAPDRTPKWFRGVEGFHIGCLENGQVTATGMVREHLEGAADTAGQRVEVRVSSPVRMR